MPKAKKAKTPRKKQATATAGSNDEKSVDVKEEDSEGAAEREA